MDDDGGICWFQTVAEEQEYIEWLDGNEFKEVVPQPVNAAEKESENVELNCQ